MRPTWPSGWSPEADDSTAMLVQDEPLLDWPTCTAIDPVDPEPVFDPARACGRPAPYLTELVPQPHHRTTGNVHARFCPEHAAAIRSHPLGKPLIARISTAPTD